MKIKFKTLGRREAERLLGEVRRLYPSFPLEPDIVERAVVEAGRVIYVFDGEPCFWESEASPKLIPVLLCLEPGSAGYKWLPGAVFVDKGAAVALARGANLMVPGIVEVIGEFSEGEVVVAVYRGVGDVEAPVMVGVARIGSGELRKAVESRGKGIAVKKLHHVGDKVWEAARLIRVRRRGGRS